MEAAPQTYLLGQVQEDGTIIVRPNTAQAEAPAPKPLEPGKTYVARLPGHSRPAFIRQKRKPPELRSGFSAMTDTLFTTYIPLRSRSVESNRRDVRVVSAPIAPPYAMLPPQQQLHIDSNRAQSGQQPGILIHSAPPGPPPAAFDQPQSAEPASAGGRGRRTRTHEIVLKHTCASCGKFRSPSYHHRHPLAPDEDPKPGFCRKCKKVQTSSDESTEGRSRSSDSRRRRKPSKKKKKKERHERSSSAEPNRDDGRSSSREEVIRVVHRSRSAASKNSSRDEQRRRRHSPSSPESPARIRVSYKPSQKKSRAPTEKIQVIDRFRYVDPPAERRSRSRSRSFGISHSRPRERYDEPDDFVHVRRSIESRRPIRFITYRKDRDGNLIEELHQETTELAHGRRLDSTVAQHETRYELSGQERHQHHTISKPRHYYKGSLSSQESFENNAGAYSPPRPRSRSRSRSVRVLRVPYSSEDTNVHSWESESAEIGTPRVTFATDEPIRRRSPSQRRFSEDRLPIRRRRHRARESDDFPVNIHREESLSSEHLAPPRSYRDVRVPTPPSAQWRPHDRYPTSPPQRDDRDLTHMFETTRLAPPTSPPPTRGRPRSILRSPPRSRSASAYRPAYYRNATDGGTEYGPVRYLEVGETVTFEEDRMWRVEGKPPAGEYTR